MIRLWHAVVVAAIVGNPVSVRAQAHAADDFSATTQKAPWSYGWSHALGSTFNPYVTHESLGGLDYWEGPITATAPPGSFPIVVHNGTSNTVIVNGSVRVDPGRLLLHPGPDGQYSIVRYTAATEGRFSFEGSFLGLDFIGPTSTDVHVLLDGVSLFDGVVSRYGSGPSFSIARGLKAGDTVDFAVGFGARADFRYDSTGLNLTVTSGPPVVAIPEPSIALTLMMGLSAILLMRRRSWVDRGPPR